MLPYTMPIHRLVQRLALLSVCVAMVTNAHTGHQHQAPSPDQLPKNFNDPKITQDEEHLKEHLKDEIDMKQKMTPEQMEFYYFRLHDANNDTHLDGTEILQAMSHMLPVAELELHEKLGKSKEQIADIMAERQQSMMKYYEDMIDQVLTFDDTDKDGYLTYSEFVRARRRDEFNARKMQMDQQGREQQEFEQFKQFQAMQAANQGAGNQGQFRPPPPPQGGQQQQQQHQQQQQQFQQQPNIRVQ